MLNLFKRYGLYYLQKQEGINWVTQEELTEYLSPSEAVEYITENYPDDSEKEGRWRLVVKKNGKEVNAWRDRKEKRSTVSFGDTKLGSNVIDLNVGSNRFRVKIGDVDDVVKLMQAGLIQLPDPRVQREMQILELLKNVFSKSKNGDSEHVEIPAGVDRKTISKNVVGVPNDEVFIQEEKTDYEKKVHLPNASEMIKILEQRPELYAILKEAVFRKENVIDAGDTHDISENK